DRHYPDAHVIHQQTEEQRRSRLARTRGSATFSRPHLRQRFLVSSTRENQLILADGVKSSPQSVPRPAVCAASVATSFFPSFADASAFSTRVRALGVIPSSAANRAVSDIALLAVPTIGFW